MALAQVNIKGKVTSPAGNPVSNATIIIKGDVTSTTTDQNGDFNIEAAPDAILVINHEGFSSIEKAVNNQSNINIILQDKVQSIDEVVLIGYGTVKKSDLTGSVSKVDMKTVKDIPASSVEGLLQGRSAGLQVINNSQDPNSGATVRIRGSSSLNGSNAPLLVVDGIPFGDANNLKQINPADIVSIEVLKDASASSIYGSRGSNGVIMVTTKDGKKGKLVVNAKFQTIISNFTSKLERWTDPALMAQLDNESRINAGLDPLYIGAVSPSGVYYPSVTEITNGTWPYRTDWAKTVFRSAPITNVANFSINSANDNTSYNLSAGYWDQEGVFINDDYNKFNVSLKVKHKFSDKFNITSINNFTKDNRNTNNNLAYYRNPLWPIYNADGTFFLSGPTDYDHPLALTDYRLNKYAGTDFMNSLVFDWDIFKNINLKSQQSYTYGSYIQDRFDPAIYTENGTNNKGAGYIDNYNGNTYTTETFLTYDKLFGTKHKVNVMLGNSYQYTFNRTSNLESYGFPNGTLFNENMGAGTAELNRHYNNQIITKLLSYFVRANYAFNNKYLLTLTMRGDGSSKFGANNKWGYFPSGAVSWKIHEEKFIKNISQISELKLRASYGISGNQGISPYQTLSRYGIENFYNNGTWNTAIGPGYVIGYTGANYRYQLWGGIPNESLKWETTSQYDFGLDLGLYKNRIHLTADYYNKHTSDLLRERYLPLSSGYDKMWVNDGEIENKGIELTLDADIIRKKDTKFSMTFIFSRNRNKVLSLGSSAGSGLATDYMTGIQYEYYGGNIDPFRDTSPNILGVELPINVFYGYKVIGIVQSEADGLASGLVGDESHAGEFKYEDLNKDGVIDARDRTIIGDPNADFTASLNLSFTYKKFDIGVFLNGVFGNDIIWGGMYNSSQFTPLRWTPDNPTNDYPSLRQNRLNYVNDWYIKDGSFLRIQNINVGYTFLDDKSTWFNSVRISLNTDNVHTFTKFKGYDPEVGLDGRYYGGYPRLRRTTIGIDIKF